MIDEKYQRLVKAACYAVEFLRVLNHRGSYQFSDALKAEIRLADALDELINVDDDIKATPFVKPKE